MNESEDKDNITNNANIATPFEYPEEPLTEEERLYKENQIHQEAEKKAAEFLNRFLALILPCKDTRLELISFAMACGVDVGFYFGTENTVTAIAKQLGCSKQVLSYHIKAISEQFSIHNNSGKTYESKTIYQTTNFQKSSNADYPARVE